jgi:hypothetical protein
MPDRAHSPSDGRGAIPARDGAKGASVVKPGEARSRKPTWTDRYGDKHRWRRYRSWLPGIAPPAKVRLYERGGHYLLNWWSPADKRNLTERIVGDLLTALARARIIDDRLSLFRSAGNAAKRKVGHAELVAAFLADVECRIDARLLAAPTLTRYRAALDHYLDWCRSPDAEKKYPHATNVNREFRLELAAFLARRTVCGNGRKGAPRPMKSQGFVLDVARTMFEWAADAERGNLMPEGFKNPFLGGGEHRPLFVGDPLAAPKITMAMAAEFIAACNAAEKKLFGPMILFGLRASEPCFLFHEHLTQDWLEVPNIDDLDYFTKGKRGKRFPWTKEIAGLRDLLQGDGRPGLLYRRSDFFNLQKQGSEHGDLAELTKEYRRRLAVTSQCNHLARLKIRKQLLREAGALHYDDIETLFQRITAKLGWTVRTTLKDFRHLFATTLSDANISESYRKYLLGHAPGREASVAYTHLHRLREQFAAVLCNEFEPVLKELPIEIATA